MRSPRPDLGAAAGIVVLVLAWGSAFAAIKVGLESAPPLLLAGMRTLITAVVLCLVAWRNGGRPDVRRNWWFYLSASLLSIALFYGLQTVALEKLPSGLAAVIIYLQPVLVGLFAWRLLGERLTPAKVVGLLLGFGGIVVVSVGAIAGSLSVAGMLAALGTAMAWAIGTIQLKGAQGRVDPWWALAVPFTTGGVVLTLTALATEGARVDWSPRFGVALGYASLVGTALAWLLWQQLLLSGDATRAAAFVFFVPITALLIGVLFLGEDVGPTLVIGALLVVVGVRLVNRPPAETRNPVAPSTQGANTRPR